MGRKIKSTGPSGEKGAIARSNEFHPYQQNNTPCTGFYPLKNNFMFEIFQTH